MLASIRFITVLLLFWSATCLAQPDGPDEVDARMIIQMETGDSHLLPSSQWIERWFELQTATISNRFQYFSNSNSQITTSRHQYQSVIRGSFRMDSEGDFRIQAGIFPGRNFSGGWNNSGWGSGNAITNVYLKQLYLEARLFRGIELQYGGFYPYNGESTEITGYDNDGYITGQRIQLRHQEKLFFDEISLTAGYLGDFNTPNVIDRFDRLNQANFYQFLFMKKIGKRIAFSADYSLEPESEIFRQAFKIQSLNSKLFDALLLENYQRTGSNFGYGFAIYAEKTLNKKFVVGGGYAQIDRTGLNSDRFPEGKRFHVEGHLNLGPLFSSTFTFTQGIGRIPRGLQRTRFEIGLSYNLLQTIKR